MLYYQVEARIFGVYLSLLLQTESVHTGRAAEIRQLRQATLESAYVPSLACHVTFHAPEVVLVQPTYFVQPRMS